MKDGTFNRKYNFIFAVGMSALMGGLIYSLGETVGKVHGFRDGYLSYDNVLKESQENSEE